ncbi:MAG: hypothetical protein ACFFAU_08860 [Candidatus Hodarchaeota archaeon]
MVTLESRQLPYSLIKSIFDKRRSWLYLSLALNLVIHLIFGLLYYNPVDFVIQFEAAKKIAQGKLLYRDIGEIIVDGLKLQKPQYPPLYLYSLGSLIALIGVDTFTWQMAKIFLIVVNLIVGLLLFYIIKTSLNSTSKANSIALVAFNFYLLNPSTLGIVFGGFHDNFMILFVLIGFITFKKAFYSLSGTLFGLALLVKPIAGIYMIPILLWGINTRKLKSIKIWIIAGVTFFLGSLPFLLIVPDVYLNDVFFIHAQRPDPSMSLYTYFFSKSSTTLLPFLLQFALFLTYSLFFIIKIPITNSKNTLEAVTPFMTIFMASNRILYPHYIPFFFPFFTMNIFFLVGENYKRKFTKNEIYSIFGLIMGLILIYIGAGGFGILWIYEKYETYQSNPLFLITSLSCILGLIIVSLVSLLLLNYAFFDHNRKIGEIHDERKL